MANRLLYNLDLKRLVVQMLPLRLRTPSLFGLMRAACIALEDVYNAFVAERKKCLFRLNHNGQVCYLRAALNDTFKSYSGRFEILTIERMGRWLYAVNEAGERIPVATPENVYDATGQYQDDGLIVPAVYNDMSIEPEPNKFCVLVPADLYITILPEIKALVNEYKLLTKDAIYMAQS